MLPSGLRASQGRGLSSCSSCLSRFLYLKTNTAAFSTSTPRSPRAPRPSSLRSRTLLRDRQDASPEEPLPEDRLSSSRQSPSTTSTLASPSLRSPRNAENEIAAAAAAAAAAASPVASTAAPKYRARAAPPGLKAFKQTLFISELIRMGHDDSLSYKATRAEHQQMVAAGKFFEQQGCKFLYSAEALRHHARNDHIPEIVVLGASNVGKSSFLNALLGRPGVARVSSRPGMTTLLNAYGVGPLPKIPRALVRKGDAPPQHSLVVVDTPGYGYKSRAGWGDAIVKYIGARNMLRGAVVLLSSDKKLMDQDRWIIRSLAESNTRTLLVLTKADKSGSSWETVCSSMAKAVRDDLKKMERAVGGEWKEGSGWTPEVHITSAGMDKIPKLGNGGGMGGVRSAILDMAGFSLEQTDKVSKKDETLTYTGAIVSFDDIKWKT